MIASFVPVLILVGFGFLVYELFSHRSDPITGASPDGDLRQIAAQVFRLGLLAVSVILVAEGFSAITREVIGTFDDTLARDSFRMAQGLAFIIVGVPALVACWWWTRERIRANQREEESVIWAAYLAGILILSVMVSMWSGGAILRWAAGVADLDQSALGRFIAWTAVAVLHWRLNSRRPIVYPGGRADTRTPMYLLAGSALGLIMLAFGSWRLIEAILGTVYDNAFRDVLVSGGWTLTASAAIDAVVGGIVWVRFWVFGAFRSQRSSRRYGYALLGGVLGGFVAAVSAAGTIVFAVLQWWFGEPDSATAVGHFAQLPGAIGGLLVGLLVWFHHRSTIGLSSGSPVTETQSGRVETDRIYDYLIAFVALFVTAIASTLVMVAFIEAISAPRFVARSVSNSLVLAATFLVVGAPLFWIFWSRLQRTANVDHGEAQSLSRRVFLTVVLGLGAAVALGSLVGSLIVSFEDLVDGAVNSNTFYDMRVWFGLLFTAVASTMYFGSVQRVERARRVENNEAQEAVPPPLTPALVVITDLDVVAVAEALSNLVVVEELAIAGTGVRASDQALAALREELSLATCPRALVTLRDGEASWEPLIEIMRPT